MNGTAVTQAALDCATLLGSEGTMTISWGDTTLRKLGPVLGETDPQPDIRVIAVQVTGRFHWPFSDNDQPISMLLTWDPTRTTPNGVQIPATNDTGGLIDLTPAGTVHH